jgi:histidinol-phosphate aminotransferase
VRLREVLGALHGVAPWRVVVAASASEFIQRITAVGSLVSPGAVQVPTRAYGDYEAAARAWQRQVVDGACERDAVTLRWCASPSSPLGLGVAPPGDLRSLPTVLDAVYAPLQLDEAPAWSRAHLDRAFVLCSPNKALGMAGVRGAYAIAPAGVDFDVDRWCAALDATAPSWPLSAHAVAMLDAWATPRVQEWVTASRSLLASWKAELRTRLVDRGFEMRDSVTHYFCVRSPVPLSLERLRERGVAVRDTASFGLPGEWRISAQPPAAIAAFVSAVDAASTAIA